MSRPRILYALTSSVSVPLLRGQLRFLGQAGFDVFVVSSPGPELETAAGEGAVPIAVPMEREVAPLADLLSLWHLYRTMRRLSPVLVNVGTPKAGLLAGLAASLAGVPCRVYTMRGLRAESATGGRRRLLLWAEKIACRCAHRILCVSSSLRQEALEHGLASPEKMQVLGAGSSNGVDASAFATTPERLAHAAEIRRQFEIALDSLVVGFAGRLTKDKGVPELLDAFLQARASIPDLRLLLLGSMEPGDPLPSAAVATLQGTPGVLLAGEIADPAPYFHAMDVLVLPTHREGFPNIVLEAHAAGKPVITTRATGAVDSVEDGVSGLLVPVGDVPALAAAIARLAAEPSLRARMGAAGRERVVRDFSQPALWGKLLRTYLELLAEKRQPMPSSGNSRSVADAR